MALAVRALVWPSPQQEQARRALALVAIGAITGLAPFGLLSLGPHVLGAGYLVAPEVSILSLGALPLSMGAAILSRQFLGISRLVGRGTRRASRLARPARYLHRSRTSPPRHRSARRQRLAPGRHPHSGVGSGNLSAAPGKAAARGRARGVRTRLQLPGDARALQPRDRRPRRGARHQRLRAAYPG